MLKNRQELEEILLEIEKLFPNASCELVYHNLFELLIAVMLSAQTTDKSVNLVTPNLFNKYPTALDLSNAVYDDVKSSYKVKLTTREDAVKFYKLLKALFIMQTEIKNHFNFTTKAIITGGFCLLFLYY